MDIRDDTETTCDGHSTSNGRKRFSRIHHMDVSYDMEVGIRCARRNTHLSIGDETCRRILENNHIGHRVSVIGNILECRDQTCQLRPVTVELCRVDVRDNSKTTRDSHSPRRSRKRLGRILYVRITHDVQRSIRCRHVDTYSVSHSIHA